MMIAASADEALFCRAFKWSLCQQRRSSFTWSTLWHRSMMRRLLSGAPGCVCFFGDPPRISASLGFLLKTTSKVVSSTKRGHPFSASESSAARFPRGSAYGDLEMPSEPRFLEPGKGPGPRIGHPCWNFRSGFNSKTPSFCFFNSEVLLLPFCEGL